MSYFKCNWNHNSADEPILLYSELDGVRYETRKVEVYRNGCMGIASESRRTGNTDLGNVPVPELKEINLDPEFVAVELSQVEFEEVWKKSNI